MTITRVGQGFQLLVVTMLFLGILLEETTRWNVFRGSMLMNYIPAKRCPRLKRKDVAAE